jgi:hypothetical protein
VLFAQEEVYAAKSSDSKTAKAKASSSGVRVLRTRNSPAYDAKNRHGLPDPLPLDFDAFTTAMRLGQPDDPAEIRKRILGKLDDIADAELTAKVKALMQKAGSDAAQLAILDNKMTATVRARKGE